VGRIKKNFDGVAKGKLGTVGARGVFRNDEGLIFSMCASTLRSETNNVAELDGLIKGLSITIHLKFRILIVEGDFPIIIQILSRLLS
jgi:ribonuclease HI